MTSTIHRYRWHPHTQTERQTRGVYLLHGIGEHAGRYERLANRLTELGYEVGAHDHPGHGQSSGKRGVLDANDQLETCAAEQFDAFKRETGSTPFLFGHSLGGLTATSMLLNHKVKVSGLLLSVPAYTPLISRGNKFKLAVLNFIAPRFAQELPYNAHYLTHDKVEQERASNDPLNHRYKSASIITWLVNTGKRSIEQASNLDVSTLILIAGDDRVIDSQGIRHFINAAPKGLVTEHFYPDYRHEILNETPERRQQVLVDIEQWLATEE